MNYFLRIILFCTLIFFTNHIFAAPYALIYNGEPTCEGCPEALADVVKAVPLPVKYVSHTANIPSLLKDAKIFIIGGTQDDLNPFYQLFKPNIVAAIQQFVRNGGIYLGICGGAFVADNEQGNFQLIQAKAIDYEKTTKAHLLPVDWQGKTVLLYFQAGPAFVLQSHEMDAEVVAVYKNGQIAALMSHYGNGMVFLIGPHLEADVSWLKEDGIDSTHWQSQQGLLVDALRGLLKE